MNIYVRAHLPIVITLLLCAVAVPGAVAQTAPACTEWTECSEDCDIGFQSRNCSATIEYRMCNTHPCNGACDKCPTIDTVGYLPDPLDCRNFYQCQPLSATWRGGMKWRVAHQECGPCLHFNPDTCSCDYACCKDCITGCILFFASDDLSGDYDMFCASQDSINVTYGSYYVSAGSSWDIYASADHAGSPSSASDGAAPSTSGTAMSLLQHAERDPGGWGDMSDWSDCYPICEEVPDANDPNGTRYRHRFRTNPRPLNWCDAECPCEEEEEDCEPTLPCPTGISEWDCPEFFCLKFEDDTTDSFGAHIGRIHGRVSFSTNVVSPLGGTYSGCFDEDSLQVDYFNNWFTYPHNQRFTLAFLFHTHDTAGVLFSNGCVWDGGLLHPSFSVHVDNGVLRTEVVTTSGQTCSAQLTFSNDTWSQAVVTYDGGYLTLYLDECSRKHQVACQDGIRNNKCPLTIGDIGDTSSADASTYYNGYLDEVKAYQMGNIREDVDCPCHGPATTTTPAPSGPHGTAPGTPCQTSSDCTGFSVCDLDHSSECALFECGNAEACYYVANMQRNNTMFCGPFEAGGVQGYCFHVCTEDLHCSFETSNTTCNTATGNCEFPMPSP